MVSPSTSIGQWQQVLCIRNWRRGQILCLPAKWVLLQSWMLRQFGISILSNVVLLVSFVVCVSINLKICTCIFLFVTQLSKVTVDLNVYGMLGRRMVVSILSSTRSHNISVNVNGCRLPNNNRSPWRCGWWPSSASSRRSKSARRYVPNHTQCKQWPVIIVSAMDMER